VADIMKASRPAGRSRRPKTFEEGRVCAAPGCTTVLSKYNRSEYCNVHKPVKYPRLRGVLSSER